MNDKRTPPTKPADNNSDTPERPNVDATMQTLQHADETMRTKDKK